MIHVMGIDQYGGHWDDLGPHPRKALIERTGYKSPQKMYVDKNDGSTKHIGYICGNLWIRLFNVTEWNKN